MLVAEYLLIALMLVLFITYLLRSVLMVGYEHLKYKNKREKAGEMLSDLVKIMIRFKPLYQRKLTPKGYDFKVQQRFQKKFNFYYVIIWASLFLILFLVAKIYLDAF